MRGTMGSPTGVDVLEWPLVGRLLRWRHARTSLQLVLLAAAAVVVLHGLFGPDIAPGNLATVLTWVHYRGIARRRAARRRQFLLRRVPVRAGSRLGPPASRAGAAVAEAPSRQVDRHRALRRGAVRLRALRSVGAAAGHGVSGPRLLRRRAGDRHGLQRRDVLQAPVPDRAVQLRGVHHVAARAADSGTGDLPGVPDVGLHRRAPVAGGAAARSSSGAASSGLYLPAKVGNIDCTFCLDCVHACPHDNIAHRRADAGDRAGRHAPAIGDWPARQPSGHRGRSRCSSCSARW